MSHVKGEILITEADIIGVILFFSFFILFIGNMKISTCSRNVLDY